MTSLSYAEVDALFSKLGYGATSDPAGEFGEPDVLSFAPRAKDSIATFREAAADWAACGRRSSGEVDGCRYWIAEGVRAFKGQRRRDVVVIELTDGRTAVHGLDS